MGERGGGERGGGAGVIPIGGFFIDYEENIDEKYRERFLVPATDPNSGLVFVFCCCCCCCCWLFIKY